MLILNALNILKAYIVCVLRSVHCPVYTYPCLVKLCRANTILRPKPIEFTAKQPWMHGQRWFARTLLLSYQKGMRKYNTRSDIVRCFAVSLFREHGYSFGIGRYIPAFLLLKKAAIYPGIKTSKMRSILLPAKFRTNAHSSIPYNSSKPSELLYIPAISHTYILYITRWKCGNK